MTPKPPYRRMPLAYLAAWIVFTGAVLLYQGGVPQAAAAWAKLAASALIGGALWGWVLWRFWLYKKFP
jgi:hypothetical protein